VDADQAAERGVGRRAGAGDGRFQNALVLALRQPPVVQRPLRVGLVRVVEQRKERYLLGLTRQIR